MKYTIEQSWFAHFFTADKTSAPFWFIVRLYVGYEFLMAGWSKISSPAWFGSDAGAALQGFVQRALEQSVGAHPDVPMWYASFLQGTVPTHASSWANAVTIGELAIGLGLIVGLFTGAAAFFAFFMTLNFMLAGAVMMNPILLLLAIGLMLARRVAGYWGLDRYARPYLYTILRTRRR